MADESKEVAVSGNRGMVMGRAGIGGVMPQNFEDVMTLAMAMARSGLYPKSYEPHGNPPDREEQLVNKLAIAMNMGMEIGLKPMQAPKAIAVIGNMPSLWGDMAKGLVMASGVVEDFSEEVMRSKEGNTLGCRCTIKRKGIKSPTISEFTVDDARRAGLWDKAGPWKLYPKRMLQMRARLFAIRDACPDVLGGLAMAEEVQDLTGDYTVQADGTVAADAPEAMPQRQDFEDADFEEKVAEEVKDPEPLDEATKPKAAEKKAEAPKETEKPKAAKADAPKEEAEPEPKAEPEKAADPEDRPAEAAPKEEAKPAKSVFTDDDEGDGELLTVLDAYGETIGVPCKSDEAFAKLLLDNARTLQTDMEKRAFSDHNTALAQAVWRRSPKGSAIRKVLNEAASLWDVEG